MPKPFYITTAIDYTNGAPHIGHAYEKVLADVIARYHRLKGEEVVFLTGVDQHGQKVQQSAEKAGVAPRQFVDVITAKFVALWEKLDVRYDIWAATTEPLHKKCVQGILQRLYDEKQIYKDKQEGYYSVRQEQFLTDKERGPDGEFGPEWGQVEHREEENYYFKLAGHKDWLLRYLRSHPNCVTPGFRQTELINAVEKLSGDLCISRPKSRLSWGIELPFDPEFVTYVWFDALTNYISFAGYDPSLSTFDSQPSTFLEKWPALHVIGKDILIPAHGIYWPIMLHALGFPDEQMPKFLVHGWWNISGAKMSKSEGNVVDPDALADKYGAEALRYYLMSDIGTGMDSDFSEERLVGRYNSDLANSLGNLLNRVLNMLAKYRARKLRKASIGERFAKNLGHETEYAAAQTMELMTKDMPTAEADIDSLKELRMSIISVREQYERRMGATGCINEGIQYVLILAAECNQLVDLEKPWSLAKATQDVLKQKRLDAVLYHLAESLRIIAILVSPVSPQAAHGIFDQLNWKLDLSGKEKRFVLARAESGELPDGHVVGQPVPLFPRIE